MNCTTVDRVKAFLDSNHAHYIYFTYSNAYSPEKIQGSEYACERELIESVLININHKHSTETAMIVVPATRKIDLNSLKTLLGNSHIDFVSKQQAQLLFPGYEPGTMPPFRDFYPGMRIFFSHELFEQHEIAFCIQNPANRIKMPLKDFLAAAHPVDVIEVATIAKYKIEIAQIFPVMKKESLNDYGHCMLGFSLQSQSFTPAKLAGLVEWIARHFSECSVLIGDGIHRITLEINGTPVKYALNRALRMGRESIDRDAIIFNRHQHECRFNIISSYELQQQDSYHFYHQALIKLFEEDEKFRQSVRSFAGDFVGSRLQQEPERFEYYTQMSCDYLLEEVAITALLLKSGVFVFVYPGTLTIMQELSQGLHPGAPEEFKNLVSVNLRQKRR